eukprot:TRINITY_DN4574_c0_g1_i1.p1 TRINITY_DN4574_c0_g1~~TRINITY_DN4574_c0_g1_i1.p1  ORF type:complete len:156 (-),score=33.90 TRINITY_DN4574_c0_g1_i1:8-475(-)
MRNPDPSSEFLILYATQTGNSKKNAEMAYEFFRSSDIQVKLFAMNNITPRELSPYQHIFVFCSSFGPGLLAPMGQPFMQKLFPNMLVGKKIYMLSLGSTYYRNTFNRGGLALKRAFQEAGAQIMIHRTNDIVKNNNIAQECNFFLEQIVDIFSNL